MGRKSPHVGLLILYACLAFAQQQCYFGPGATNRGPTNLVPCLGSGTSACCLLGDICLSGNACWNYDTGDLYQYGCNDITYKDASCPYKCGFTASPWAALEYCTDLSGVNNTYVCHSPESCGCDWGTPGYNLATLKQRGCKEMGDTARAALYAPPALAPYVSLPSKIGGSTGYFSPITVSGTASWVSTAISGYTPSSIGPLTTYGPQPSSIVLIQAGVAPAASTIAAPTSTLTPSSITGTATTSVSPVAVPSAFTTTVTASAAPANSKNSSSTSSTTSPTAAATGGGDSSLSTGAKAGIGVGVAGFAIAAVALLAAFLFWRRNQRSKRAAKADGETTEGDPAFGSEKTPAWSAGVYRPDSQATYEAEGSLPGDHGSIYTDRRTTAGSTVLGAWSPSMGAPNSPHIPSELPAGNVPQELQGSHVEKAELES